MRWAIFLGLLLLSALHSYAQEQKFKVRFNFVAGDDSLAVAKSYIARELRALGDVEITDRGQLVNLEVIAQPLTETKAGRIVTFAFVANLSRPARDTTEANAVINIGTIVNGGAASELEAICKSSVAQLDSQWLEEWRAKLRKLKPSP